MTPRKASLRVAHEKGCPAGQATSLDSLERCKCKPSYYVLWRDRTGATRKSPRVRDRRTADMALRAQQVEIDQGNIGYQERREMDFPAWVDEYTVILGLRKVKGSTRRGYDGTLEIAKDVFGSIPVRAIGQAEMRRFHTSVAVKKIQKRGHVGETAKSSDATVLRRLRELGACLQAAMIEGYADTNPVPRFRKSLRLRAPKTSSPPFTDAEIARLYAGLAAAEPVYLAIVKAAVETGCRIGELVAMDWSALKLLEGELRVTGTWDELNGLTTPKDGEARTVYLTPGARTVLEAWAKRHEPDASGPLFPSPTTGRRLHVAYARRLVHGAMTSGAIPLVDPGTGLRRKPFHSLRATFTRRQLEAGRHPQWVEAQLGHSSLDLTIGVYGSWSRDAMIAEAAKE